MLLKTEPLWISLKVADKTYLNEFCKKGFIEATLKAFGQFFNQK
ncbi:unnamed protein product [Paramecium sonneborni]|uniref:Uncharacterized protein n=1 Tax=Paramecium sonneborni TaxID=65129 RepID=A0A8S1RVI1_9CILI|nr:unnamed protein product [Paramecium sonneborni]